MYAIEFEATVQNGMIPIPPQYLTQLQSRLKVIVLQEEAVVQGDTLKRKDEFLAKVARCRFQLPPDYHFKREELYDRI